MVSKDIVASGTGLDAQGNAVIKVYTAVAGVAGIPGSVEGVPVHTETMGRIYSLRGPTCDSSGDSICTQTERWPLPVPIGVSVGHPAITAGTIGARVTDGSNVFILSNNHVIADVNSATIGDNIIQPGGFDGGFNPDDAIATLNDFEPISFTTTNLMDAGIALSTPAELGYSTPMGEFGSLVGYGAPSSQLHPAYGDQTTIGDENMSLLLNAPVQKVGRTTSHTFGNVTNINAAVNVCYDQACTLIATFVNQLIITPGTFSAPGDSGSLIVSNDGTNRGVGLLFAGSSTHTIANRIDHVLNRFGVTLDNGAGSNVPPTADFTSNQTANTLTMNFDGSASSDTDGTIASYVWNFGDGATGTGIAPSHTYAVAGSYTVALTVTDDGGASHTASQTVVVDPAPNTPPTAAFTSTQVAALFMVFNGSGSSDSDGSIASYDWDFGDGAIGKGIYTRHIYAAAGSYIVTLTVTDDAGATGTVSQTITVQAQ